MSRDVKSFNFTKLEKSILHTLAYYNALGVNSLTITEVQKYLFNDGRHNARLFNIKKALKTLKNREVVKSTNGFWHFTETKQSFDDRIHKAKTTLMKWHKFEEEVSFLTYIPYVNFLAVTGSVSLANSHEKSDIDILVRSKHGTIWTTRFLVTLVSYILKRRRYGEKIKNRLCFNHYQTERSNKFGPAIVNTVVSNIYIPVWSNNQEIKIESIFSLSPSRVLMFFKTFMERMLTATKLDNMVEKILGKLQIKKIKNNPVGYPEELPNPSLGSSNIIFYYPKVKETQNKYMSIINRYNLGVRTH